MRILHAVALLALALCGWTSVLSAQVNTSSLRGTVADPAGALLPGAQVMLRSNATGVQREVTVASSGEYGFEYVPAGVYTVTVKRDGFQTRTRESVRLEPSQIAHIDFVMLVGSTQQSVEVSAATEQIMETTTVQQTGQLTETAINQLPVAHQDWSSILQLNPSLSTYGGPKPAAGVSITINGLPPAGFNLTIDGTNATSNPESPAIGFFGGPNIINTINNDAIAQVAIVKGIAPAPFGGTMSGNINIITKSGGRSFHGSLNEVNELSTYDARNQFVTVAKGRPRATFNEFGGSIGGPILRDRLFFFGSYEGARYSTAAVVTGLVPTPYLASISPAVYAPFFAAFPSLPQPSASPTAVSQTYNGTFSKRQKDGNGVARLDYYFNPNNQLSVRYVRGRPYLLAPLGVIPVNQNYTTGHTDAINAAFTHVAGHIATLSRFGANRIRFNRLFQGFGSDLEEITVSGIDSQGAENFTIAGRFITAEQSVVATYGHHTLEAGAILQRTDSGRTDLNTTTFGYSTLSHFQSNSPDSVVITFDLNPFNLRTYQYGGYIQDDYSVTKNLTLNLGLRYDYFTVPQEDTGRVFNRGVDPANPQLGPGFGPYRPANSMYNADWNNVQPRVGAAWNVGRLGTVIRGGAGAFVNPHPLFGGPISEVQSSASTPFRITLNASQVAAAGLKYPLPRSNYAATLAALQANGIVSSNFANTTINGDFPNPYSLQWMFGIEQQLPFSTVLEADYIGTRGLKENMVDVLNLPSRTTGVAPSPQLSTFQYYYPGDASNYHALQTTLKRPFTHNFAYGIAYTWARNMSFSDNNLLLTTSPQDNNNIKAEYGRSPFDIRNKVVINGLWQPPIEVWTGTHSHAGRLLTAGWQVSAVFTGASGLPANLVNRSSALYPSDRPDVAPGVGRYLSGYHSATAQAPYPNARQYLNPCAFLLPAPNGGDTPTPACSAASGTTAVAFTPGPSGAQVRGGNFGRFAVNLPGVINLDAGIAKTFEVTESVRFQLKMDAFNALNHTNLFNLGLNPNASNFGTLNSATARTVQLTGRLTF